MFLVTLRTCTALRLRVADTAYVQNTQHANTSAQILPFCNVVMLTCVSTYMFMRVCRRIRRHAVLSLVILCYAGEGVRVERDRVWELCTVFGCGAGGGGAGGSCGPRGPPREGWVKGVPGLGTQSTHRTKAEHVRRGLVPPCVLIRSQ